jgi:sugar phosphate isomerase/epimerase
MAPGTVPHRFFLATHTSPQRGCGLQKGRQTMLSKILGERCLCSRRQMLKTAGALAVGAAFADTLTTASDAETQRMQPGIFLDVFHRPNVEARFDAVKAVGLKHVQVAMTSVGLDLMPDRIPQEAAERLRRAATSRGITITAVQGTFNMGHPDAKERAVGLRQLRVLAEACPTMGIPMIHICTGTRNLGSIWSGHPDNQTPEAWRDMADCVRQATKIAEQCNVVLGFEPEVGNIVGSAEDSRKIMDAIGSPNLKVAIDGANVFHKGELARMDEVLDRTFELIGKDIVMAHAKDLDHDGDGGNLPVGHGKLDYDRYLSLLKKYGFHGPLLMHSLNESHVPGCVEFLRTKLAKIYA